MEGSGEGRGVEWEGELSGEGRGVGRGGGVVTRCEDNELGRHGNAGEWSVEYGDDYRNAFQQLLRFQFHSNTSTLTRNIKPPKPPIDLFSLVCLLPHYRPCKITLTRELFLSN